MSQKPSVLVIDDESGILDTLRILLKKEGFDVTTAQGGKAGLEAIKAGTHDIVLTDVRMPQVTGLDILTAAREQDPMTPVILMTAQASLQTAIAAVNAGAYYYIQKPFANDELVAILRRACEYRAVRVENKHLRQEIKRRDRAGVNRPIGKSRRFLDTLKLAEQVAPTDSTVLIQGESGTGKEVIARYLHNSSSRTDGPFLSINCGALPENLLESELFGHVKGSFTGAVRDKQGLFAAARGGASSSTRSARCLRPCRSSCSGCSRSGKPSPSARPKQSRWTSASSPPPIATSRRRRVAAGSGPTCSTG